MLTGASSGIGAALAAVLAQRGYQLVLVARSKDRLEQLASEFSAAGAPAKHRVAFLDLASLGDIEPAIRAALGSGAAPDVLVNGAGAGLYRPFLDCSAEDAARLMNVNYFAAAELIRILLPGMLARGRGHIINIASISAKVGPWGHSAYSPAKAALVSLTQTLAAEHAKSGVHFSYVNPGIVETGYFENPDVAPLWPRVRRRAISAEMVAGRIARLLDRPKLELCVPRHYRVIEFISALHAGLAQRLVAWQSRPVDAMSRAPQGNPTAIATPFSASPPASAVPSRTNSLHPA